MNRGLARLCALTATVPLLGGCVALAALPLLAGGAMVAGGNAKIRAATPRPPAQARIASPPARTEMTAGTGIELAGLTELPPPDRTTAGGAGANPWQPFLAFALDRAARLGGESRRRSTLLKSGTSLELPRMRDCPAQTPAVLIDLDSETRPFIPDAAAPPPPALVEGLARLREAGVVVAWISGLPAAYVSQVGDALRASGLDAKGEDPLLLARSHGDRKQLLREEANADVCVIAIAGDDRADFDELFGFLRDPASAAALDFLLGAGWFIVPPPLG